MFLFKFVSLKFNYQLLQKGRNCQKILHSYNAGLCITANCLVFIIIHILINCGFWFFNLNVHKSHHLHACLIYYLRPCCIVAVSIVVHRYYIIPIKVPYSGKVWRGNFHTFQPDRQNVTQIFQRLVVFLSNILKSRCPSISCYCMTQNFGGLLPISILADKTFGELSVLHTKIAMITVLADKTLTDWSQIAKSANVLPPKSCAIQYTVLFAWYMFISRNILRTE